MHTLTHQTAAQYVVEHFAAQGEHIVVTDSVLRNEMVEAPPAIEVIFNCDGDYHMMMVWLEDGKLVGEM